MTADYDPLTLPAAYFEGLPTGVPHGLPSQPEPVEPPEPEIIVNGVRLSYAQSMATRVALGLFVMQLTPEYKAELGPVGQRYEDLLNEVFGYMLRNQPNASAAGPAGQ